jgi:hypothetical protein
MEVCNVTNANSKGEEGHRETEKKKVFKFIILKISAKNDYYQVSSCQKPLEFSNYLWEFYIEEAENKK